MTSNDLCKACTLLEGLERGMASSGIVRRSSLCSDTVLTFGLQTDRGRKQLEASGPAPENIRTIPFFKPPTGYAAIAVETPS